MESFIHCLDMVIEDFLVMLSRADVISLVFKLSAIELNRRFSKYVFCVHRLVMNVVTQI